MHTQLDGKKFILTLPLTRFKVSVVSLLLIASIWTPWHLWSAANAEIAQLKKQKPTVVQSAPAKQLTVVSPYAFSEQSKSMLETWLLYGAQYGHEAMLKRYSELTKDNENYKPFLYALESEWRLGHWDSAPKPH